MNNNIIGIIVGVIITFIVAIFAGTSTADGSNTPLVIIGVIIGLIVMIAMKDKVWILLVLSIVTTINLPGPLAPFRPFELALGAVLPFYLLNVFFQRSKLTWNGNKFIDLSALAVVILIASLMIRFPIGVAFIEASDYVNSRAYIDYSAAFVFFIVLSTVSTDSMTLRKTCIAMMMFVLIMGFYNVFANRYLISTEQITEERFSLFGSTGLWIATYCCIRHNLWDMIRKPWIGMIALLGVIGISLGGFRNQIASFFLTYMSICWVFRRYLDIIISPILVVCLLMAAGFTFGMTKLPMGFQRSISFLPFIEVDSAIRKSAQDSTNWRVEMWEWALDDNERLIKNRVWGDGFAQQKEEFIRLNTEAAMSRGDNNREFASRGAWHSGPISTIHRMGYVGLAVVVIILAGFSYYSYLVCRIYVYKPYGWGVVMFYVASIPQIFKWLVLFGDINSFYTHLLSFALMKLLLNRAKIEGLFIGSDAHRNYVPLMMRETAGQKA